MRTCAIAAAFSLCLAGSLGAEEKIEVPSGQEITFVDVVHDAPGPDGLTYRFRFLAPAIARVGGTVTAETALEDMQALCDGYALPRVANPARRPARSSSACPTSRCSSARRHPMSPSSSKRSVRTAMPASGKDSDDESKCCSFMFDKVRRWCNWATGPQLRMERFLLGRSVC
mgnify:CR=1 FL=1